MIAVNHVSKALVKQLDKLDIKHCTGYFGGNTYCI